MNLKEAPKLALDVLKMNSQKHIALIVFVLVGFQLWFSYNVHAKSELKDVRHSEELENQRVSMQAQIDVEKSKVSQCQDEFYIEMKVQQDRYMEIREENIWLKSLVRKADIKELDDLKEK